MFLGPESAVTTGKEGWFGWRQEARNWAHNMSRCSLTVMISASMCRWSAEAIMGHPVAILSAAFWMVWSLMMLEGLALGNQIGAA